MTTNKIDLDDIFGIEQATWDRDLSKTDARRSLANLLSLPSDSDEVYDFVNKIIEAAKLEIAVEMKENEAAKAEGSVIFLEDNQAFKVEDGKAKLLTLSKATWDEGINSGLIS